MLRKLALSLAIAGALSATQANALGLGEIQVNSALNEPLDAEIRLLEVRDLSPLQIQPRMADIDEFSLAGISKSNFLSNVNFDVQISPDGVGKIHITSSSPIREPFLNFLVEVNWPSGRLVREYTLLLDPPVFDNAPAPSVVRPARPRPSPQHSRQRRRHLGCAHRPVPLRHPIFGLGWTRRPKYTWMWTIPSGRWQWRTGLTAVSPLNR